MQTTQSIDLTFSVEGVAMTKNFSRGLVVAFAFFVAALPAHAANIVINPGFETGDFTGWTEGGISTIPLYSTPPMRHIAARSRRNLAQSAVTTHFHRS
jgi:hypothetical protein